MDGKKQHTHKYWMNNMKIHEKNKGKKNKNKITSPAFDISNTTTYCARKSQCEFSAALSTIAVVLFFVVSFFYSYDRFSCLCAVQCKFLGFVVILRTHHLTIIFRHISSTLPIHMHTRLNIFRIKRSTNEDFVNGSTENGVIMCMSTYSSRK